MRDKKLVWVTLRVEVEVEDSGYPELAGRLAEMEAKAFANELTSVPNLNKASRCVVSGKVVGVSVWEAEAA